MCAKRKLPRAFASGAIIILVDSAYPNGGDRLAPALRCALNLHHPPILPHIRCPHGIRTRTPFRTLSSEPSMSTVPSRGRTDSETRTHTVMALDHVPLPLGYISVAILGFAPRASGGLRPRGLLVAYTAVATQRIALCSSGVSIRRSAVRTWRPSVPRAD